MKRYFDKVRAFVAAEDGPTAVEYAVLLSMIVVICLTAIQSVGTSAKTTFSNTAASMAAANGS